MTLYVASGASVTEKKNEIFMVERALHTDIYSVNYWVGGNKIFFLLLNMLPLTVFSLFRNLGWELIICILQYNY